MSSSYPYGYSYDAYYHDEWMFQFFAGLLVVGLIFMLLIGLIFYVFQSMSLYKIAKRRCIRYAWLAWLPVGSAWIVGSVSDQYQYVVKGKNKRRRFILILLSAAVTVLSVAAAALSMDVLAGAVGEMMFGTGCLDPVRVSAVISVSAVECVAATAYLVLRYIALYDLYTSCTSRYNVLYLVLGIIFNFLEPFFLFACRNRDEGMPPRREMSVCCEEPVYSQPEQTRPEE